MLPPPTLLDRVIGGLPIFLLVWGAFLVTFLQWLNSSAPNQFLPFILGFFALVSRNARARVLAHHRWEQEKAEAMGKPPVRASRLHLVWLLPVWAFLAYLAFQFAGGWFGFNPDAWLSQTVAALQAATVAGSAAVAGLRADALLLGLVLLLLVLWRAYRRHTGKSGTVARAASGWKGTVRVMLPVPRE